MVFLWFSLQKMGDAMVTSWSGAADRQPRRHHLHGIHGIHDVVHGVRAGVAKRLGLSRGVVEIDRRPF